jgi:hypothetical protein
MITLVGVPRWPVVALGIVLLIACSESGSGHSDRGSQPKARADLTVEGVAATPFSATLRCGDGKSRATGSLAGHAAELCRHLATSPDVFDGIGDADRQCTQIYGGPEHARIRGSLDGHRVDIEVSRNDGCGIGDWKRLEWLLGPPAEQAPGPQ